MIKPSDFVFSNSKNLETLRNIQQHMLYIYENCPICKTQQTILYRYLNRVCDKCLDKYYLLDSSNNRILVGNLGICGGIQAFQLILDISENLVKSELPYQLKVECYINGLKCIAQECHYGGIILTM
jgi:hypothetical protein